MSLVFKLELLTVADAFFIGATVVESLSEFDIICRALHPLLNALESVLSD